MRAGKQPLGKATPGPFHFGGGVVELGQQGEGGGKGVVKTEEQIRAQLQAEANAAIEELLQWGRSAEAPDLTQMEDKVLWLRDRLGQRMLQLMVEGQEAKQPEEAPRCPECGEPMRYKGQRASYVQTRLGTLRVERGHYHCARCEGGLFPPRQADGSM